MALLYFTNITTHSAMADALDSVSHDQLTRMLQGAWAAYTPQPGLTSLVHGCWWVFDPGRHRRGKTVGAMAGRSSVGLVEEAAQSRLWGLRRLAGLDGRAGPHSSGLSALAERWRLQV